MNALNSDTMITFLTDTALEAGVAIMGVYAGEIAVTVKSDASPVTEADARAEAIILEKLKAFAPDIPVVAEEEVAAGRIPVVAERFFLVDPLDGTKEFINRNGEFTVNIALIEHGVPTAGVVYAPALGDLYVAADGKAYHAAVKDGVAEAPTAIAVRPASGAVTAIGSRSHNTPETQSYLGNYNVTDFRAAGSSLKFCLVASGEADLYPRFGRTMEWDTAAGDAVLRAAGGSVVNLDGSPLVYGKRNQPSDSDFANPFFIAAGGLSPLPA